MVKALDNEAPPKKENILCCQWLLMLPMVMPPIRGPRKDSNGGPTSPSTTYFSINHIDGLDIKIINV